MIYLATPPICSYVKLTQNNIFINIIMSNIIFPLIKVANYDFNTTTEPSIWKRFIMEKFVDI